MAIFLHLKKSQGRWELDLLGEGASDLTRSQTEFGKHKPKVNSNIYLLSFAPFYIPNTSLATKSTCRTRSLSLMVLELIKTCIVIFIWICIIHIIKLYYVFIQVNNLFMELRMELKACGLKAKYAIMHLWLSYSLSEKGSIKKSRGLL